MKYIFFLNPMAGQGKSVRQLISAIKKGAEASGVSDDLEIYTTKSVGDGESAAKRYASNLDGEEGRFYACGGDGTLSEIVNGVIGYDNISVGCVPIGTGNDTVRNFPQAGDFFDMEAQLKGTPKRIDLIKYSGILNDKEQSRYCVNMFNIGFDCNVVELAGRLKEKPFIAGSAAYLMAVGGMFIEKKGIRLKLTEGDEILANGEVLLCAIANGSFCGGGIKSSPQAAVDDGVFDVNIIKDVSRTRFLKLFPKYKNGTHLDIKGIEDVVSVKKCSEVRLYPREKNFFLCADGEIYLAEKIDFSILPSAINFLVPIKEIEK